MQKFGQWIVDQQWDNISDSISSTDQARCLETLLTEKLDQFCPQKEMKVGTHEKPFISAELKKTEPSENEGV